MESSFHFEPPNGPNVASILRPESSAKAKSMNGYAKNLTSAKRMAAFRPALGVGLVPAARDRPAKEYARRDMGRAPQMACCESDTIDATFAAFLRPASTAAGRDARR